MRRIHVAGGFVVAAAAASLVFTAGAHGPRVTLKAGAVPATCKYRAGGALPDMTCTPGVTNPAVTQTTIGKTICKSGWTASIRPPLSVTRPEKRVSMRQYGVAGAADYEYDHLISLELGGAPNDTRNLWPEPHTVAGAQGSFAKDGVENRLKREVCAKKITLATAQHAISSDWRTAP